MSGFAHIINGIVFEVIGSNPVGLYHPALTWVPVPNGMAVAQGWSYDGISFSPPPAPAAPTPAQLAGLALGAGLLIQWASNPTLSGTYAVDPVAQGRIASVSTYILVNGKFPGGQTQYPWIDLANQTHLFTTTADFQTFATTVADYVAVLDIISVTNSGTLPMSSVNIP